MAFKQPGGKLRDPIFRVILIVLAAGFFFSSLVHHEAGFSPLSGAQIDLTDPGTVSRVGQTLVARSAASKLPYSFTFQVLAAPQLVNAFVLPGGMVFISDGLLKRLHSEDELAAVLGHEIGHILSGNTSAQIARNSVIQGLAGGLGAQSANTPTAEQLSSLEASRQNEIQADFLGVCILSQAGYDPHAMIGMLQVLKEAPGSGSTAATYLNSHPDPALRIQYIQQDIAHLDQCPK
jgi:predicted Zn-dependent protease